MFPMKNVNLSIPCGKYSSNFETELKAIKETLLEISKVISLDPELKENIVIFTDSLSSLQAMENWNYASTSEVTQVLNITQKIKYENEIDIIFQWIPGHTNLPGNETADSLAKEACSKNQPDLETSLHSAKTLIKEFGQKRWVDEWAQGKTGRFMQHFIKKPTKLGQQKFLNRKEESKIFQLRTGHCMLNKHLSRIRKDHDPACRHCLVEEETINHHLLQCPKLTNIRKELLPPSPSIESCLYTTTEQLKKTASFHILALAAEKG
jgi:ribonuclease HI